MGRKKKESVDIGHVHKDLRYTHINSLIKSGVIKSFSDIIRHKYISRSLLSKDLNINALRFYNSYVKPADGSKGLEAPDKRIYKAYNFKMNHILHLSLLFEVSPTKIVDLVLKDDVSDLDINKHSEEGAL